MRGRYRATRDHAEFLTPGAVYEFTIDPFPTANVFKKGHRIRVDISSSNFPRFDANPNTGEPLGKNRRAVTADNTVYHSATLSVAHHPADRTGEAAMSSTISRDVRMEAPAPTPEVSRRETIGAVLRVASGNFLEMYDFIVYGYYATYIAKTFFPTGNEFASLMLALMTFGVGYLMRPIGAVVLGAYIDRVGRRRGLIVTLGLMAIGTFTIAATPGYASIGLIAPVIIVIGRLIQGLSAGVELGGVSVYLAEIATPGHRGFYCSWQSASQQLAVVFTALLGLVLTINLTGGQMSAFGWRIPLIVGCLHHSDHSLAPPVTRRDARIQSDEASPAAVGRRVAGATRQLGARADRHDARRVHDDELLLDHNVYSDIRTPVAAPGAVRDVHRDALCWTLELHLAAASRLGVR